MTLGLTTTNWDDRAHLGFILQLTTTEVIDEEEKATGLLVLGGALQFSTPP